MKSQEFFPVRDRLDSIQINEIEGYKSDKSPSNLTLKPPHQLILKYHEALVKAENEILELQEKIFDMKEILHFNPDE